MPPPSRPSSRPGFLCLRVHHGKGNLMRTCIGQPQAVTSKQTPVSQSSNVSSFRVRSSYMPPSVLCPCGMFLAIWSCWSGWSGWSCSISYLQGGGALRLRFVSWGFFICSFAIGCVFVVLGNCMDYVVRRLKVSGLVVMYRRRMSKCKYERRGVCVNERKNQITSRSLTGAIPGGSIRHATSLDTETSRTKHWTPEKNHSWSAIHAMLIRPRRLPASQRRAWTGVSDLWLISAIVV